MIDKIIHMFQRLNFVDRIQDMHHAQILRDEDINENIDKKKSEDRVDKIEDIIELELIKPVDEKEKKDQNRRERKSLEDKKKGKFIDRLA